MAFTQVRWRFEPLKGGGWQGELTIPLSAIPRRAGGTPKPATATIKATTKKKGKKGKGGLFGKLLRGASKVASVVPGYGTIASAGLKAAGKMVSGEEEYGAPLIQVLGAVSEQPQHYLDDPDPRIRKVARIVAGY